MIHNQIKIDMDSLIKGKLKYVSFAKTLVFLADKLKGSFIYMKDLANFLKVTDSRAGQILRDFERLGFIFKKTQSSLVVEWHGIKNGDKLVLEDYVPLAIETLKRAGIYEDSQIEGKNE